MFCLYALFVTRRIYFRGHGIHPSRMPFVSFLCVANQKYEKMANMTGKKGKILTIVLIARTTTTGTTFC